MKKSESIKELAAALSKAQSMIEDAGREVQGHKYKYADLSQILQIVRPAFSTNELSVSQFPCGGGETVTVETILMHSSGEWLSQSFSMAVEVSKGMSKAQAAGSVITYMRRYALAAIAGITQEDNDAALAKKEANKDYSKCIASYINETDQEQQKILWEMFTPEEQKAVLNHFDNQG